MLKSILQSMRCAGERELVAAQEATEEFWNDQSECQVASSRSGRAEIGPIQLNIPQPLIGEGNPGAEPGVPIELNLLRREDVAPRAVTP